MKNKTLSLFLKIAIIEGYSFLILLALMPVKRIWHYDLPTKVVGWTHGGLLVFYLILVLLLWIKRKWKFKKVFLCGIMSLIPFGTFWLEKKIKRENW